MESEVAQQKCGEVYFGVETAARCTVEHGTEHSHSDYLAFEAIAAGVAEPISLARGVAECLPACDDEMNSDLISLCDIVITGVETGLHHFGVSNYDPRADGSTTAWAILNTLRSALPNARLSRTGSSAPVHLNEETMRDAVERYAQSRLDGGMPIEDVLRLVDGSYTDAVIADSILQFAIYEEEVFS